MTLPDIQREKIIAAIMRHRDNFEGTDGQFAKSIGINGSVFSRLKKGESTVKVLRDEKLIRIGRQLSVQMNQLPDWHVVKTPVFEFITEQLKYCQEMAVARIFCDHADIGKTTAAKYYMLNNKNVFYVDCSQNKTKRQLVKAIATLLGVGTEGALKEIYKDTIYVLQCTSTPLIILDEAGDLDYDAWLEIKAMWNALEGACGWYMMGADGLKAKINRHIRSEKVGYAEIFRRFGSDYMRLTTADTILIADVYHFLMCGFLQRPLHNAVFRYDVVVKEDVVRFANLHCRYYSAFYPVPYLV